MIRSDVICKVYFIWVFPEEMKGEGSLYLVTPTILPGIILTRFSLTAKNAAWGPP